MIIYLIRHAQTDNNLLESGIVNPSASEPLNAKGRLQSNKLAEYFIDKNISHIYSSKTQRTVQTAKSIAEKLNLPVETSKLLEERDWGEYSHLTWTELAEKLDKLSIQDRYQLVPRGGESWSSLERRGLSFFDQITKLNRDTIVVSHKGFIRALLPKLLNLGIEESLKINPTNGQIYKLSYLNGKYTLEQ